MNNNKNKLLVRWSKREKDFVISYPTQRQDGHLAYAVLMTKRMHPNFSSKPGEFPWGFDPSFIEELESRGYDTKTLKFSVEKKP